MKFPPLQDEGFLLLLQSSMKAIPFNILLSAFIWGYLLHRQGPFIGVTGWFLAIAGLSLIRLLFSRYCINKKRYIKAKKLYLSLFIVLTFFMGALWGLCYIVFSDYFAVMHQNVITIVLGGMAAGAIASLSIYLPAYYAYLLPMFLPLIGYNYALMRLDNVILATMFIIFVIMLMITAKFPSTLLQETLTLSREKDDLINNLHKINREKDRILAEIQRISITDALTGLYNRRYFDGQLDTELRRAKRNNYPLCLVLIDVDNFKSINDNYGHPSGDAYLQKIASIIKSTVTRANDMAFRIGGDEFAIIFANSALDKAKLLCLKIQEQLKTESSLNEGGGLSIGIVALPPYTLDVQTIVTAADTALYTAKQLGKNQICSKHIVE